MDGKQQPRTAPMVGLVLAVVLAGAAGAPDSAERATPRPGPTLRGAGQQGGQAAGPRRGHLPETTPPSSASAARSWPTCTTSGNQANAATCPRARWPNSNQPAILAASPRSTAASGHPGT